MLVRFTWDDDSVWLDPEVVVAAHRDTDGRDGTAISLRNDSDNQYCVSETPDEVAAIVNTALQEML